MQKENGYSLSNNLKNHKSFNLFYKEKYFATFEYDKELQRYQSDIGYLTMEDVYKISNSKDKERKIVWSN